MPCRSDYMEPSPREVYNQKTAKLFLWLVRKKIIDILSTKKLVDDANDIYCKNDWTSDICTALNSISKEERVKLFNEEEKIAAELKLWWLDHLEGEERRAKEDSDKDKIEKLKKSAFKKLTKEERKALGL